VRVNGELTLDAGSWVEEAGPRGIAARLRARRARALRRLRRAGTRVANNTIGTITSLRRRRLRERGIESGKGGAVTAVQRVSSDLRIDPHFHTLARDGVFSEDEAGELSFHALPCLTNDDVADLLQIARARILALLRRKGVIADADENDDENDDHAHCATCSTNKKDKPPTLAPARGPPWFKSRVIRRRLGEPVQAELFDAH